MMKSILTASLILGTASLATAPANASGPLSPSEFQNMINGIHANQAEQRDYIQDYVRATESYNRDSKIRAIARNIKAHQKEQRAYIQEYVQATEGYNRDAKIQAIAKRVNANQAEQRIRISKHVEDQNRHVATRHTQDNQLAQRLMKLFGLN